MKNKPNISEMKVVTLGVENLGRATSFYKDTFTYVEKGRGTIAGKEFEKAWRMPKGVKGQAIMLGARGINSGMLRLVQFDKPGERIWDDYPPKEIIGHYAVNFGVKDLRKFWPNLIKNGAVQKAAPTLWKLTEDLSAWDSQAYDPDGVLLDVFEMVNSAKARKKFGVQTRQVSEVQTMAIHVSDALRSKAFYQGLGFKDLYYETMIENLEKFFDVPAGTKLQNINLMKPELSMNGRIEITQYIGFKASKYLRDRAVPPNIGALSISFETDNMDATAKLVKELGGEEISKPVEVMLPKLGKVILATFFGPDGEALEFYQPTRE